MHIQNKFLILSVISALALTLAAEYSIAEEESATEQSGGTYNVKTDTICKKQNGKTFCTDKKGKPLTGDMVKYKEGIVVRRYHMKNGYLDGVGIVYGERVIPHKPKVYRKKKGRCCHL